MALNIADLFEHAVDAVPERLAIACGDKTVSYTELATLAGSPAAMRAAGQACARNLIIPIVPCHRVVRRDGTLGGYAYGLPVKQQLLDHERRHH